MATRIRIMALHFGPQRLPHFGDPRGSRRPVTLTPALQGVAPPYTRPRGINPDWLHHSSVTLPLSLRFWTLKVLCSLTNMAGVPKPNSSTGQVSRKGMCRLGNTVWGRVAWVPLPLK